MSPTQYVERLDVRYGEDAFDMPADAIREIHDLSGEVTYQDSGKSVASSISSAVG